MVEADSIAGFWCYTECDPVNSVLCGAGVSGAIVNADEFQARGGWQWFGSSGQLDSIMVELYRVTPASVLGWCLIVV